MKTKSLLSKLMVFSLAAACAIPTFASPMSRAGLQDEQSFNMRVVGTVTPSTSLIDVVMPLRVDVTIDATQSTYDKMFTSPEVSVINNTVDQAVKLTYETGSVTFDGKPMELVPSGYFSDWSKIGVAETSEYLALGIENVDGWEVGSAISKKPVWFDNDNKAIGTIKGATSGDSVTPAEAKFEFTAKHGTRFVKPSTLNMNLYFKVEKAS